MPDLIPIIKTAGLVGVILIVFAESGLFFGFFFPGDSLLFSAGLVSSLGFFDIKLLLVGSIVAAILGDSVGYWTGKKIGPRLFYKDKGFFFKKQRIDDAEAFYKKHGIFTIILARFVPIIRTFAPIVAGIGKMNYKTFIIYNVLGGIGWVTLMVSLGYFLGQILPNPDVYILPIVLLIIVLSFIPITKKYIKIKKEQK